jgi:hypothetical protein
MKKKKFSKEFLMKRDSDWVNLYNLKGNHLLGYCVSRFRRIFPIRAEQLPLDKPTKVRVDITIL